LSASGLTPTPFVGQFQGFSEPFREQAMEMEGHIPSFLGIWPSISVVSFLTPEIHKGRWGE